MVSPIKCGPDDSPLRGSTPIVTDANSPDDLLKAVAKRDRAAFRALFRATSSKLFGVSLRICRDRSLAEDALQEAFVDIWRKAADFDTGRGAAMGWMSVIVRNRSVDLIRRRGRGPRMVDGDADNAPEPADPGAPTDGGTDGMALTQCLGELEARERELVVLAYCEGYSREELSERYEAPVNTVKTWLRRGLAALKDCLEQ